MYFPLVLGEKEIFRTFEIHILSQDQRKVVRVVSNIFHELGRTFHLDAAPLAFSGTEGAILR